MIRILLIPSSDYLGHPFPQRHNHLFERINDGKDFEVHVIRFRIFDKQRHSSKCIIHEIPRELKIRSTALYYLANVSKYTSEIMNIIKNESIDIVVAGNLLPPLVYQIFQRVKEKKLPFIFDLQDYYPTSAAGYITKKDNLLGEFMRGFFESITQYLIKSADIVTVPGIALASYAKNVGAKKVEIIPNGISEHFLKKYDGSKIREKLGFSTEDLVVGYIGSIEFWLDMKTLIKGVSMAKKSNLPLKLLLIGKHLQSNYVKEVENEIRVNEIQDITTWLDFIPYEKVPEYISAMDIGVIPFDVSNLTAYYAAPNKLWEYLSQQINVISTPIPEVILVKNLIEIARNENEYYEKIIKIYKNRTRNERNVKVSVRTWDKYSKLYSHIIKKVINSFSISSKY